MTNEIHAHNVLNLLRDQPLSEQELRDQVATQFGPNAAFRTCKMNGFDLDALLAFFIEREKIVAIDGKWALNQARVCSH
ncbi:YecH family metal-binding protein [Vibrio mexicanus]|uniref:YecH family metal-binding protein n=1 Tax=Vibrio mexicanus TaxID=1004326 RepID=UPI00063C8794|nr:YecH family metal-binding protein [Vibrio mexicanus]